MNAKNPNSGDIESDVTPDLSAAGPVRSGRSSGRNKDRRKPRTRRARVALLPDLLTAAVERSPESSALVCGSAEISYRVLDSRSSRLARVL
ncbi:hypothetical protein, partial [Rhodococcus sp. H29-C3]|uniref:hypothetical protein n=1 Tax=Rhodococcus sp. H29-C3 TaxID=3046307 RepID=UPI0024BA1535